MRRSYLVLLLVSLGAAPSLVSQQLPSTESAERQALMDLFAATGGDQWTNREGWGSSPSYCDWFGVTCDLADDVLAVDSLDLTDNNLRGSLPASFAALKHLNSLRIAHNHLSGVIPESMLQRWDTYDFEFVGWGNTFSNFVTRASFERIATGTLCDENTDINFRGEFDVSSGRALFQSVRCVKGRPRRTYCLVREGTVRSLDRFSRSLRALHYTTFEPKYFAKFSFQTHDVSMTTHAVWGDGSQKTVETYGDEGPIEVSMAEQLFLALVHNVTWEKESRRPHCDLVE